MQHNNVIKKSLKLCEFSLNLNILLEMFANIIGQFCLTQVNKWLNKAKSEKY